MSMLLNEEQTLLKDAAHGFFEEKLPIPALRKLRDDKDTTGFDRDRWREMAEMGWAGVLVPEAYGGVEFGYKGLGQILEESGRTLAASPLVSTVLLCAPLVLAAGNEIQKQEVLGAIAGGERILALALEETQRHAPTRIATTAEKSGDGYRLNGAKTFVLDGHVADQLIVIARTSGANDDPRGLSLFLVDGNAKGLTRRRTVMVDSRNAANITLDNVDVGADALLGPLDDGFAVLEPVLDGARIGLAAEMLGNGLEAFTRTLEYLKMREQFGVPIGSFQALKHRAALMFCEIELTTSAVLEALTALDEKRNDVPQLASLAKAKACEMLELVSNEAVQLHGGIGMTDEEEIGFFLKRARVAQQTFGDAIFHRDRYATLMGF
ncbi:MAG: acyl-CoA dehydrogenase family protein [Rhodospirillales bacterium]|nr:acyl-CoA dehydrogenase family protein [Rhodospirillales bacterium]